MSSATNRAETSTPDLWVRLNKIKQDLDELLVDAYFQARGTTAKIHHIAATNPHEEAVGRGAIVYAWQVEKHGN